MFGMQLAMTVLMYVTVRLAVLASIVYVDNTVLLYALEDR